MFQIQKWCFLLGTIQLSLVVCSKNFQHDSLVHVYDGVKDFERNITRNGKWMGNYLKDFTSHSFWSFLEDDSECKNHADIVIQQAERLNILALKMLDASAKLPSGILNGNLNQYGDFDECLTSKVEWNNNIIEGKYCLANIAILLRKNETDSKTKVLDSLIHSHRMLTNELKDQGHRIPRFETFNWGVCLPSSCTSQEIEKAFNIWLREMSNGIPFHFEASVTDEVCYVKKKEEFSSVKLGVKCIFSAVLVLIVLGTFFDFYNMLTIDSTFFKIIKCFSLKRNISLLLETKFTNDEIKCLHGARFLNAIALLLSHKQIAMLFNPIPNRTEMSEGFGKTWTMIGRSAILYTDSFIMFSGLLASYSLVKDLDNKKKINFKEKLINRIIRFTPNLFCIIMFCTYIMNDIGSGPQWGLVVQKYANLCKKYMWRNFLFIHNHFGFENMCLTHTHQLGIDMQLFLLSPIFVFILWKVPKLGSLFIFIASVGSSWLRYDVTYKQGLSTLLYYGISVERLWKTANLSYILPTHRLTVYLMGIALGFFLRRGGNNLKFSKTQAAIGWVAAITAGLAAVFKPYNASQKDYVYDSTVAANFNTFAPVLWVAFECWVILACINGYGGFFDKFLSWKYFLIFTKISYAFYLTQFPVFFYNVGTERSSQYYKGFHSLFDVLEYFVIILASIIVTLTFDIPFQELKKVFKKPHKRISEKTEKNEKNVEIVNREKRKINPRKRLQYFGT